MRSAAGCRSRGSASTRTCATSRRVRSKGRLISISRRTCSATPPQRHWRPSSTHRSRSSMHRRRATTPSSASPRRSVTRSTRRRPTNQSFPSSLSPTSTNSKPPIAVAITGGIGAGKSAALAAFGRHGAATRSSDEIVHRLLSGDPEVHHALAERFGSKVIGPDGADREAIGRSVLNDTREQRLIPDDEKLRLADYAYVNDGTLEELDAFVAGVMSKLAA